MEQPELVMKFLTVLGAPLIRSPPDSLQDALPLLGCSEDRNLCTPNQPPARMLELPFPGGELMVI